jgi:hypothetical protein
MLIHVVYDDNHFDYVKDVMLDQLIRRDKIKKFKRSTGWVIIGIHPIRERGSRGSYIGAERRGAAAASPLIATGAM